MSTVPSQLYGMGKVKGFLKLFFPILLVYFSSSLYVLVEKLLLARIFVREVQGAVAVAYICQVFQAAFVALAMMAQVSVATWVGAKNLKAIGPGIWQFIWFSIFSIVITFPLGLTYGSIFLKQASLTDVAFPYLCCSLILTFLYPLGTALSCFYLGQGLTRLVLFSTIGSQLVKIGLASLLILGWGDWIPTMGLMGGIVSTIVAQVGFCLILLYFFISPKNKEIYGSHHWKFQPKLFWESIQPGLLRALNRVLNVTSWTEIARLTAAKSPDYLSILSIGGIIFLFLPFLGDAICQTQTIVVSQIIGAKKFDLLGKAFFSGFSFAVVCIILTAIPLIGFPEFIFTHLFPNIALDSGSIYQTFLGIWVSFAFLALGYVGISYVLAFKDMYFSLFMGAFNWVNGFLLMYVALNIIGIAPAHFWLTLSLMHGSTTLIYFLRARYLCSRSLMIPPPKQTSP